jgi:hypothetical protein
MNILILILLIFFAGLNLFHYLASGFFCWIFYLMEFEIDSFWVFLGRWGFDWLTDWPTKGKITKMRWVLDGGNRTWNWSCFTNHRIPKAMQKLSPIPLFHSRLPRHKKILISLSLLFYIQPSPKKNRHSKSFLWIPFILLTKYRIILTLLFQIVWIGILCNNPTNKSKWKIFL